MTVTKAGVAYATAGALALALLVAVVPVGAQQAGPGVSPPPAGPDAAGPGPRGPGMMGPGMMFRRPGGLVCDDRMARFSQMRLDRIERAVVPTDVQRQAFDAYKAAAAKALEIVRAACPTEQPLTPTGRLELMEKQLEARLQAVRVVRPALEAFYKLLSDEQKARFNVAAAPAMAGWGQGRPGWHDRMHRRHSFDHDGRGGGRERWGDNRGPGREGWGGREHDGKNWRDNDGRGGGDRWRPRTGFGPERTQDNPQSNPDEERL